MHKSLYIKSVSFLYFLLFLASSSYAQLDPVKWSFEVEKVSAKEYDIIFTADIERGWSVYSQHLEAQKGPIPTSFEFDKNANIQLVGSTKEAGNKKETFDKTFGIKLIKFSNKARFTQRVKVQGQTDAVRGTLTYMTCDDSSCLPPADINFSIALKQ